MAKIAARYSRLPVAAAARQLAFADLQSRLRDSISQLSGCDGLVLECNHDTELLANGDYPYSLKLRSGGKFGHLDNGMAAALLAKIDTSQLKHLVAAHLSQHNNRPELARAALCDALGCAPEWIGIADQQTGFDWREFI